MKRAFSPVLAGLLVGVVILSLWHCQGSGTGQYAISELVQDSMFRKSLNPLLRAADACQYNLNIENALILYQQALPLAPNREERAYIANQMAHLHLLLDQDSSANYWIGVFETTYPRHAGALPDWAWADYCYNKGIAYGHAFRSDSAFHYLYPALELYRKIYPGGRHLRIARCLNALGMLHYESGDLSDSASLYISTAAEIFQSGRLQRYAWESYYARASLCLMQRSHDEGSAYAGQALQAVAAIRPRNLLFEARCLSMKGNMSKKLKRYDEADYYFSKAIDVAAPTRSPLLQFFYRNLIINDLNLKDTTRFFRDYQKLQVFLKTQQVQRIYPDRLLGYYFFNRKQWAKSIECYETFLTKMRSEKRPNPLLMDEAMFVLSDAYLKRGNFDKALEYACRTLLVGRYFDPIPKWETLISPNFHQNKPQPLVGYSKIVGVLLGRFNKEGRTVDLKKADYLCAMLDTLLFSSVVNQNSNDDAVLNYQAGVGGSFFPRAVETAYLCFQRTTDSSYLDKAFRYSERMKSYLLYRYLLDDNGEGWRDSLRSIQSRIDQLSFQQTQFGTLSPQQQTALRKAFDQHREYGRLQKNYFEKFNKALMQTYGFQDVQKKLTEDQAMVQYCIDQAKRKIYIYYLDKTNVVFRQVDFLLSHDSLIEEYLLLLKQTSTEDKQRYIDVATQLYQLLVGPFADKLKRNGQLVIIPDRQLSGIPFEALLEPDSSAHVDTSFAQFPYLLHKTQITYSPAWKIWNKNADKNREKPNRPVRAAAWIDVSLPQWRQERDSLKKIFKERGTKLDIFTGRDCSKQHFLHHQHAYNLLHLFMHAASNPKDRYDNTIVFKKTKGDTLYGFELGHYRMSARLATLFACETASGNTAIGEGAFSLTRNFLSGGIPAAVSTLWKVDAQPTAAISYSFYRAYIREFDAGLALCEAKRQYLKRSDNYLSHPGLWAGAICIQ